MRAMKQIVAQLVANAIAALPELADVAADLSVETTVERTRDASHGDFASNVALRLAKPARKSPRDIAASLIAAIGDNEIIDRIEIAGPGFINFHLSPAAFHAELESILDAGADYGRQPAKEHPKILLEFVSANPTGPLHVGHGRHAAYGATVGNLLEAAGYPVYREYYVNDSGRQMDVLGASVWGRWIQANGIDLPFPRGAYRGAYIRDIANDIDFTGIEVPDAAAVLDDLPEDGPEDSKDATAEERAANKALREAYVEAVLQKAVALCGEEGFARIRQQSLESIRDDIRDDLEEFGVTFDNWYSEQSLTRNNAIDAAIDALRERGVLYEKDGAIWFPSTHYGDDKDRVVVRDNGVKTYFASDIAYHFEKRERGFDHLLDIFGADHHGYMTRVRAGIEAMGYSGDSLEVNLVQFVTLYRGGQQMQMSTRSGEFDTLRQLRAEVGNDAARFYYVMRSHDQHLDFDLDVATSQSNDNPVFYIQYAHARVASVFRQLAEKSLQWDQANGRAHLELLAEPQEKTLMTTLSRYPEVVELAATNRAPQHLVHYLRDLANDFHTYYNAHAFIVDDANVRDARLYLISATRNVIANGLGILGVSAPDKM
jgi:arginyl-tRNA synthetase